MPLPITLTTAGLAELISASALGTEAITIAAIGVSATPIVPDPTMTALAGELYRVTTISGAVVEPDTIHVVMQDDSANAYTLCSFALYLADGTLFGLYGQPTTILTKTAASIAMLVCDVTFATGLASAIAFGATSWNNPPASTTAMGVVELATLAEAEAGTDTTRAVTPATLAGAVAAWLAGYATLGVLGSYSTVADLASYATTAEVASELGSYALIADMQALVAGVIAAVATAAGFEYAWGTTGYFKLPAWLGGWLWQWKTITGTIGTAATETFPMEFPTAVMMCLGTYDFGSTNSNYLMQCAAINLSQYAIAWQSIFATYGDGDPVPVKMIAFGN